MSILEIAQFVLYALIVVGAVLCIVGISILLYAKTQRKVQGQIVDFTQEYSTRGFIRKSKIAYEIDGKENIYITQAKTFKRNSGPITLYATKNGNILEPGKYIEFFVFGLLIVILSVVLLCLI